MKLQHPNILHAPDDGGGAQGAQEAAGGAEGVDLTNPAVQAAIQAAIRQTEARRDEAEKGLAAKNKQLLGELVDYKKLGKPDELAAKLHGAEIATAAEKSGIPADKLAAEAERIAQAKHEATVKEWSAVNLAKDQEIERLTKEAEQLKKAEHRSFLRALLYESAIPPDLSVISPGTEDYILDTLEPVVVRQKVDDLPYEIARFKVNGALLPTTRAKSTNPDGLMDLREVFDLVRAQKPPHPHLAKLGHFLVSSARGTGGVASPGSVTGSGFAGRNWWKMSQAERAEFTTANGSKEAIKLIDASGPKPREVAA